jgi:hypothetical protein
LLTNPRNVRVFEKCSKVYKKVSVSILCSPI